MTGPAPLSIDSFRALRQYVSEDYRTHDRAFWSPGFQSLAAYRLGLWGNGLRWKVLRVPVRLVHGFLAGFTRRVYGMELSTRTRLGRRLKLAHQHGIVIHPRAVIGDDCLLRQGVTIGSLRAGTRSGAPVLGDRIEVGAGAVLMGPIRIGDDAVIGPNAVVMTNVPAGSIVAAPPARVMPPARKWATRPAGDAKPAVVPAADAKAAVPAADVHRERKATR